MELNKLPGYTTSRLGFFAMAQQADAGVQFDQDAAKALLVTVTDWMTKIEQEVEPRLPMRKPNKGEQKDFTIPAKPFKKDGTLSAVMERWMAKHGITKVWRRDDGRGPLVLTWLDGEEWSIEGGKELPAFLPMTLAHQDDLKQWLIDEHKWRPTLWNVKKDARGKPVRDDKGKVIFTSPKMQENKKLCPNLEELEGELVSKVVRWLSIRNRKSVVEGWLENPRLAYDGRLSAGAAGFTGTFRFKGSVVVNVPKAEDGVVLGREMRSLFTARPGRKLVGFDAAALENRVEAHYAYKYPGGPAYAHEVLEGDVHYKNAFVFYGSELAKAGLIEGIVEKDDPKFKPFRSRSKNGKYALSYGCAPKKLATTLQLPESRGTELYDNFWDSNEPLKLLKENLTEFWKTTGERKWIIGIDGRRIQTRSEHALVNTLFQSAGAIIMELSAIFMEKWLGGWTTDSDGSPCFMYKGHTVYRVIMQHDEFQFDCPDEISEEIGQMGVRSIEAAGKYLKLNVPLAGSYSIGRNWAETH